jgi:lipid A 3-O-deacylase
LRTRLTGTGVGLVMMALSGIRPAVAQGVRSVDLSIDNDGLVFWTSPHRRSDWFYTHGTHLEVVASWRLSGLAALGLHGQPCPGRRGQGPCVLTRVGLGQEIYTPENLFHYAPGVLDRPYAGWLHGSWARELVAPRRVTTVSVELGVTGPPSLARQVQEGLHGLLHHVEPQGWQYQIPFEVAGAVAVRDTFRVPVLGSGEGPTVAVEPHWAATAGTVRTSGEVGVCVRVGWNAPPGVAWRGPGRGRLYVVARLGSEGEAVLRDLFLDGSTWGPSERVAKEPLVGRTHVDVEVGWREVGLGLAATRTTREFRQQDVPHVYATLALRVRR